MRPTRISTLIFLLGVLGLFTTNQSLGNIRLFTPIDKEPRVQHKSLYLHDLITQKKIRHEGKLHFILK